MTGYEAADWFTDQRLVEDPFPYYEYLRNRGPVVREPCHGVVVVTGYPEALAVYRDDAHFSSINAPSGPIPPLPFTPDPYDIGPQIEQYREQIIYSDWLVTRDRPAHTAYKALLMGIITPPRLKKNEEFMWRLADRHIGECVGRSGFEVVSDLARPFTVLVVADLLGVPEEDHKEFCENFRPVPAQITGALDVAPGTTVMLLVGAINRDPRRFERPAELLPDRANARDHLSFSRGIHSCVGAPLARTEGFICLQRIFDQTDDFCVSEARHGPAAERHYAYEPTYLLRGIRELHLDINTQ